MQNQLRNSISMKKRCFIFPHQLDAGNWIQWGNHPQMAELFTALGDAMILPDVYGK